jgi:GntR family transcriptional regulator
MGIQAVYKRTRKEQVYERVFGMIMAENRPLGSKLPSIQILADRFDTSPRTVHLALSQLESNGHVVMKHGSGTFIASRHQPLGMKDTVALCMETHVHLFGELTGLLANELQTLGLAPLLVNTELATTTDLLMRISGTDAGFFLVHAGVGAFEALRVLKTRGRPVIGLVDWGLEADWPGLYRILSDHDAGGRLAARHLHSRGHRHALLVGTETARPLWRQPDRMHPFAGCSFIDEWEALGGEWQILESRADTSSATGQSFDPRLLVARLDGPAAPTAVFGVDFLAWEVQHLIRRILPQGDGHFEVMGYFDTPWSRAGSPPFSTVSLNLPAIASAVVALLRDLKEGREPEQTTIWIPPRLVVRGAAAQVGNGVWEQVETPVNEEGRVTV